MGGATGPGPCSAGRQLPALSLSHTALLCVNSEFKVLMEKRAELLLRCSWPRKTTDGKERRYLLPPPRAPPREGAVGGCKPLLWSPG